MNLVAPECVKQKHHPEWSNVRPFSEEGKFGIYHVTDVNIGLQHNVHTLDDSFPFWVI